MRCSEQPGEHDEHFMKFLYYFSAFLTICTCKKDLMFSLIGTEGPDCSTPSPFIELMFVDERAKVCGRHSCPGTVFLARKMFSQRMLWRVDSYSSTGKRQYVRVACTALSQAKCSIFERKRSASQPLAASVNE